MTTAPGSQGSALRQALVAIEKLQAKVARLESRAQEPIAICGIGCRFPRNANTPAAFWDQLVRGVDSVTEVPLERWDNAQYYDPNPDAPGKMSTKWAALLDGIDQFDPAFFGITPREAASLDPQQRLLLECTWEALENSGQNPRGLHGKPAGVYVGIINDDYGDIQMKNGATEIDAYFGSGNSSSIAAGRISYVLGLNGPAISVDTACSSSLVALHLACQGLRTGEIPMAIVGGVNVTLLPESTVVLSRYKMMALDGHCKTFDADADGYVRGEGCGVVVLKRLSDALAAGDPIQAVIRSTAVNQDGASSGLTAPNGPSQVSVLQASLDAAHVSPADVTYVEAHGTGTSLGDPIEMQALDQVMGRGRKHPLYVGSVKTNIGHLESAAGIAGLIKAVLVVQNRFVPPHLNLKNPNPLIPWHRLAIEVPTKGMSFPEGAAAISSVSSFGFSGTNANVIVEAAPVVLSDESDRPTSERPQHFLTLSAATEEALTELRDAYRATLAEMDDKAKIAFADVCYSAGVGRAHHQYRAAVAAVDSDSARVELDAWAKGEASRVVAGRVHGTDEPRIAVLFTGQGSQYAGMARTLYQTQPTFRATLDRCDELLRGVLPVPLLDVLYGASGQLIDQTQYTQPALFAVEYALMEMWESWGVRAVASAGHSLGEYVAACRAGVFSLEDGLLLIAERARRMQELPAGGSMAAVFADEAAVRGVVERFAGRLDIAASNAPDNTVISGDAEAVTAAVEQLARQGVTSVPLAVSHAFHSPRMEPMLEEFERYVSTLTLNGASARIVSNLDGQVANGAMSTPNYWRRHVRGAVRFADSVATLRGLGCDTFLEIGPSPVLIGMAKKSLADEDVLWAPSLQRGRDDWEVLLSTLSQLYVRSVAVDWAGFDRDYARRHVPLPTYPFQRSRHWFKSSVRPEITRPALALLESKRPDLHSLLGHAVATPLQQSIFESTVDPAAFDFVNDHRILGTALLPATAFLETIAAAGRALGGPSAVLDLMIHSPMVFSDDTPLLLETVVEPANSSGEYEVRVYSSPVGVEPVWTEHASARLGVAEPVSNDDLEQARRRCAVVVPREEHYGRLQEWGYTFGPGMQNLQQLWRGKGEAVARAQMAVRNDSFTVPPSLLDACLQFLWTLLPDDDTDPTFLPLSFGSVQFTGPVQDSLWSHAKVTELFRDAQGQIDRFRADVFLFNDDGEQVGQVRAIDYRRSSRQVLQRLGQPPMDEWFYETEWLVQAVEPKSDTKHEDVVAIPATLASATNALAMLQHRHDLLAKDFGLPEHAEMVEGLGRVATNYLTRAFRDLGFAFDLGFSFEAPDLGVRLGVLAKYEREFERLLTILAEDGILEHAGSWWRLASMPSFDDPEPFVTELLAHHADSAAQIEVVARCGRELAALLRGTADPLAMIFPRGSLELAERLYRYTPEARVYNTLVKDLVLQTIESLPSDRKIRIAELGAGTGGVTSYILPELPADRIEEYWFTDVSHAFLNRARSNFDAYPFMRYGLCDVQSEPESQGMSAGTHDMVIAVNMLHATADLRKSLANARSLLRPGGILILMEGMSPVRWIDITFGLTDGWWAFADDVRTNYPLINARTWSRLLLECGFEEPFTAPASHDLSQQAIVVATVPASKAVALDNGPSWLLVDDGNSTAAIAASEIVRRGDSVQRVAAGQLGERLDALSQSGRSVRGVVVMTGVEAVSPAVGSSDDVQRQIVASALEVIQTLARRSGPPELTLVTCGAQPAGYSAVEPAQATLWGLAKVIDLEHPELRCRRIDLDSSTSIDARVSALVDELQRADDERLVALRGAERHVARLTRASLEGGEPAPVVRSDSVQRLTHNSSGLLDDLKYSMEARRLPARGEVEIEVRASGLVFHDVLNALGMRDDPEPLGCECSGVVTAIGEGVTGFAVGDEVVALTSSAFDSYVVVNVDLVAPKPPRLDFEQAGSSGSVFTTAWHALVEDAQLKAGETVLVHAAAGGVGLAAVEIAQSIGARVIATAGSATKRSFLESRGVEHVFDSRSLQFVDDIRQLTNSRGVDVVLNSLAGDFIGASIESLAADGRFVEIGKRDLWTAERFHDVRPDARYSIIDLGERSGADPAFMGRLLRRVLSELSNGSLRPLPVTSFSSSEVIEAFRYMSQAKQIGKVVVRRPGARIVPVRNNGTYLVTGGTSGIGLVTAGWLVEHGARSLVLLSRSGGDGSARRAIEKMEASGARIAVVKADVADEAALSGVLAMVENDMLPLAGVVHAAGVLDDAGLINQDWSKFRSVFAAKVEGAWNLHRLVGDRPLDFFLLYSSTSSLFGAAGQANHAAANAFLDALAWKRRRAGLEAQSINWGVWSEVGSAAARNVDKRIIAEGASPFAPEQGLEALERVLLDCRPQVAVVPVRWERFLREFVGSPAHPWWSEMGAVKPRASRSLEEAPVRVSAPPTTVPAADIRADLLAKPENQRRELLVDRISQDVIKVIGLNPRSSIDAERALSDMGLDSLMAVELRNLLSASFQLDEALPATLVFDYPTIVALADLLLPKLLSNSPDPAQAAPTEPTQAPQAGADLLAAIETMSDEDIARLLEGPAG